MKFNYDNNLNDKILKVREKIEIKGICVKRNNIAPS